MTVLIMDDAVVVRRRIVELLSGVDDLGEIIQAEDAVSAVKLIEEYKPRIIILDIQVPGDDQFRNGIDVLKLVTNCYPASVPIVLSNFDGPQYREVCKRAGAKYFFDKSTEFYRLPVIVKEIAESGMT